MKQPRRILIMGLPGAGKTYLAQQLKQHLENHGSTATFLIAYAMTGNFAVAGVIGATQMISNTVLYYIHERIWNRVAWGMK